MPTYSLWLEPGPTAPALPKLAAVISAGPGPAFVPHVTLAGGVDLPDHEAAATAARAVAARLPSSGVRVHLTRIATGTTYHQCVYALVEKTPEVEAAAKAARAAVGAALTRTTGGGAGDDQGEAAASSSYMPHVSLLYSDDAADRAAFATACERDLGDVGALSFAGVRVTAWTSGGPVQAWECVGCAAAGGEAVSP